MKAEWLYRTASAIFILFAAGHTYGFLTFRPASAEARAVWEGMHNVHFEEGGASFSYANFYVGFGLSLTMFLLFCALVAWYLSVLVLRNPQAIGPLGWGLCALQAVLIGLNYKYFSIAPAIFSAVLTACLGWAAWLASPKS